MLLMAATRVGSMSHLKPAADASRKMLSVDCGVIKAEVQILLLAHSFIGFQH